MGIFRNNSPKGKTVKGVSKRKGSRVERSERGTAVQNQKKEKQHWRKTELAS